jgi:hypothetical protein
MSTAIAQNITNNITLAVKLQHSIGRYTKRFPARTSHEPSFPGRGWRGVLRLPSPISLHSGLRTLWYLRHPFVCQASYYHHTKAPATPRFLVRGPALYTPPPPIGLLYRLLPGGPARSSWILHVIFWNRTVLFRAEGFAATIVANALIWGVLIFPATFLVLQRLAIA